MSSGTLTSLASSFRDRELRSQIEPAAEHPGRADRHGNDAALLERVGLERVGRREGGVQHRAEIECEPFRGLEHELPGEHVRPAETIGRRHAILDLRYENDRERAAFEPAPPSRVPGRSAPVTTAPMSMVVDASSWMGPATFSAKARPTLVARSKSSSRQRLPRTPAVIEPPETLETRASPRSIPRSFSRQSAPRWNTMARYPPPERQRAVPSTGVRSCSRAVAAPASRVGSSCRSDSSKERMLHLPRLTSATAT